MTIHHLLPRKSRRRSGCSLRLAPACITDTSEELREGWPKRGSHSPGSYWFYNNWDFNALGSIFEKEFKTPVAKAFEARIARRVGMQDFRVEDMYYLQAPADASPDFNKSIHPAYHFRMSARDLGRFGYLFLQDGEWRG